MLWRSASEGVARRLVGGPRRMIGRCSGPDVACGSVNPLRSQGADCLSIGPASVGRGTTATVRHTGLIYAG